MKWNPFSHLRETKKYPTGRVFLSGFWQRIEDTFRVFYGDFFNIDENELGLLDYFFPLPRLSQNLLYASLRSNPLIMGTAAIPTVPLIAIKFIAASALTLISFPFYSLTHLFVMPTMNKLSERIQHLKITLADSKDNEDKINNNVEKELGQEFTTEKMRSLLILPVEKWETDYNEDSEYTLASKHSKSDDLVLGIYEGLWKLGEKPISVGKEPKAIIEITPENKKGIKALLKTNMFKTTTYLEESEVLGVIEEKLHAMAKKL